MHVLCWLIQVYVYFVITITWCSSVSQQVPAFSSVATWLNMMFAILSCVRRLSQSDLPSPTWRILQQNFIPCMARRSQPSLVLIPSLSLVRVPCICLNYDSIHVCTIWSDSCFSCKLLLDDVLTIENWYHSSWPTWPWCNYTISIYTSWLISNFLWALPEANR